MHATTVIFKLKMFFKILSTFNIVVASVNLILSPHIKHSMPNPSCHLKALILQILIYIHMYHGSPPLPVTIIVSQLRWGDIEHYVHVIHE